MANVWRNKNDGTDGLFVLIDKHDYDNLPADKWRVYMTANWDKKGKWTVWESPPVETQAVPIQTYIMALVRASTVKEQEQMPSILSGGYDLGIEAEHGPK